MSRKNKTSNKESLKTRRQNRKTENRAYLGEKIHKEPAAFWTFIILRFIVIVVMVLCIVRRDIESTFVCILVLIIYMMPQFIERKLKIDIPSTLEVIIFVFVFAAEILGELQSYFIKYPNWDTILHSTSGFLFAAVGFSLVDL